MHLRHCNGTAALIRKGWGLLCMSRPNDQTLTTQRFRSLSTKRPAPSLITASCWSLHCIVNVFFYSYSYSNSPRTGARKEPTRGAFTKDTSQYNQKALSSSATDHCNREHSQCNAMTKQQSL